MRRTHPTPTVTSREGPVMTTIQAGTKLGIRKITGRIGAEITGLPPDLILEPETIAEVRAALNEHKALVFRGVRLDDEDQQRFAGYFGPLTSAHPTVPAVDGEPNVLPVDSEDGRVNYWHTDVTFVLNPPQASTLRSIIVPPSGGETLLASTGPAAQPRHRGRRYPGRHRRQAQLFREGRRLPLHPARQHRGRRVGTGRRYRRRALLRGKRTPPEQRPLP